MRIRFLATWDWVVMDEGGIVLRWDLRDLRRAVLAVCWEDVDGLDMLRN